MPGTELSEIVVASNGNPKQTSGPTRDLGKARDAHKCGDVEASIAAHKVATRQMSESNGSGLTRGWRPHSAAQEKHSKSVDSAALLC